MLLIKRIYFQVVISAILYNLYFHSILWYFAKWKSTSTENKQTILSSFIAIFVLSESDQPRNGNAHRSFRLFLQIATLIF